jgi:hypothetical protein
MVRAVIWLALCAGCAGGFGTVRTIGKREIGVQQHGNAGLRLVSFVNVNSSIVNADAAAEFAMVLPVTLAPTGGVIGSIAFGRPAR